MTATDNSLVPAWGRGGGFIDLAFSSSNDTRETNQVLDTVYRYTWAYDERDLTQLAAVFLPDAEFHGVLAGQELPVQVGRDAIVGWLADVMTTQTDQRRHLVLNPLVRSISSTEAEVFTYLLVSSAENGTARISTTGFYRVHLVRTGSEWKIKTFTAGFDIPF